MLALQYIAAIFTLLINPAFFEPLQEVQHEWISQEPVHAELMIEQEAIQPGQPFWVGIKLSLNDEWHAYWKNPGDAGMAPEIEWKLPEGFIAGPTHWPTPERYMQNDTITYGYSGEAVLLAQITPPSNAADKAEIGAAISWVACNKTSCKPGNQELTKEISVSGNPPDSNLLYKDHFLNARARLPLDLPAAKVHTDGNDIILEAEIPNTISEAHFYPENSDEIDPAAQPAFLKTAGRQYRITLRQKADNSIEKLKGILLLKSDGGGLAYNVDLPISNAGPDLAAINTVQESDGNPHHYQGGFFLALGLAFLGGLLLNLMPCVLPVLSFKILHFVKMAGRSRSLIFKHGILFSIGVLASFWVLAGILLSLQAYGHAVGWGFQLQEPIFVGALAAIILIFGLSLFGIFEIGAGFASRAAQAQSTRQKSGLTGSFFSGVLATAVATPCTGPFLGTAVGFAVTLPVFQAMILFSALGLGMAFPYLLLSAFPELLKFLPKPGHWMTTFKELMGFLMIGTVLWLVWVFGAQTDALAVFFLLSSFFLITIACWIYGKWGTPVKKKAVRMTSSLCTIAFLCLGSYMIYFATTIPSFYPEEAEGGSIAKSDWEPFSPERLAELREKGIPVFIDFTAKWCLICQANHLVLSSDHVAKKFDELGVIRMKADWTKNNPVITEELKKFGRSSVPLYLLYGRSNPKAAVLPQVLTPEIVMEHLQQAQ